MSSSFTMPNLLRAQTYPYASSSTGAYRGLLVRKYPCWDARGPARDLFTTVIARKIKTCLEQCLPESNSFVGFSLFMVGKLPEKTKPTIMIVSDDKPRRKAAFRVIKSGNILTTYPGFELGHCAVAAEFEDLRQLGSDTTSPVSSIQLTEIDGDDTDDEILGLLSAEACAFEPPCPNMATRVYFHTPLTTHSHNVTNATCGGLFRFGDHVYALTMAHAIRPIRRASMSLESHSDSSSESDDFEITGIEDWDEDEEGDTRTLTAITSPGSKTPSELSDSEDSLLRRYDSQLSSEISVRTRAATGQSILYEEDCTVHGYDGEDEDEDETEDETEDAPEVCGRVGSIVSVDQELDIAVIKISSDDCSMDHSLVDSIEQLTLKNVPHMGSLPLFVTINTTRPSVIRGHLSETPFYTRLPGRTNFLELYSLQLGNPVQPGDSGSWAFDDNGNLVGFVVAGSSKTSSCLLLPVKPVMQSVTSLLASRESPQSKYTSLYSSLESLLSAPGPVRGGVPDEDTMTVASSLPPPSIFSHRQDRGTPSTITYSTTTTPYERSSTLWASATSVTIREKSFLDDTGPASSFVGKGNFLEDQVARLRRELERAWEIIQEKDKRLQEFIVSGLGSNLEFSAEDIPSSQPNDYMVSSQPSDYIDSQPDLYRDPADKQGQMSPSEQSFAAGDSRLSMLELVKSLKTELDVSNSVTRETRAMWRAQVDANEALDRGKKELRRGITEAIKAIHEVHGDQKVGDDSEGLLRIASDLGRVLRNDDDPGRTPSPVKVKAEPEPGESNLANIPQYSQAQPGLLSLIPNLPPSRRLGRGRRILTPRGRLNSPSMSSLLSKTQGSSLLEIDRSIDSVPEEEEDDVKYGVHTDIREKKDAREEAT
ncbi:hypothetical protein F4802DRAFT_215421 [Xylaria palmicola]|nr:hypothetical protein F4802DRAFT_215421 [Xylaria palmicola]